MNLDQVRQQLGHDVMKRIARRYANCEVRIFAEMPELTPVEAVLRCAAEEGFILAMPMTTGVKWAELLAAHYVLEIRCDHEKKTDRFFCACGVTCEEKPSVGAAALAWSTHVLEAIRAMRVVDVRDLR